MFLLVSVSTLIMEFRMSKRRRFIEAGLRGESRVTSIPNTVHHQYDGGVRTTKKEETQDLACALLW